MTLQFLFQVLRQVRIVKSHVSFSSILVWQKAFYPPPVVAVALRDIFHQRPGKQNCGIQKEILKSGEK